MTDQRSSPSARAPELAGAADPAGGNGGEVVCQTCGDVATSMRVLSVEPAESLALCLDQDERRRTVDTGLLDAVLPGDTLLVHAGTALLREAR